MTNASAPSSPGIPTYASCYSYFSDHLSKCQHISSAIPAHLLYNAYLHLKSRKWYSNRKYLTLWFVEESCKCPYAYTGFSIPPTPMPDCVIALKDAIAEITGAVGINSCNADLYQDGSNSIPWHSDNEDLFLADRQKSIIVSVSLGADRTFWIRCKANGTETPILLSHGDICTMEGYFQKFFEHCVLPEDNPSYHTSLRINLTFRSIVLHDKACPKRDE